jgi:hypothetical protein
MKVRFEMNEKLLTVLVVVSLVLSVFSLVLTFKSNGTNAIVGQSSNITWKKVQLPYDSINYMRLTYGSYDTPFWNVTLTLQWSNGTIRSYDLGNTKPTNGAYEFTCLANGTVYNNRNGELYDSNFQFTANITSLTAYEIQPPQS